jgi:hypothetical protein
LIDTPCIAEQTSIVIYHSMLENFKLFLV